MAEFLKKAVCSALISVITNPAIIVLIALPTVAAFAYAQETHPTTMVSEETRRQARLWAAILASVVILIVTLLGIYVVRRMGHYLKSTKVGGKPTEYVDAWSSYRLDDDAIERAVGEDTIAEDSDDFDNGSREEDDNER